MLDQGENLEKFIDKLDKVKEALIKSHEEFRKLRSDLGQTIVDFVEYLKEREKEE